MTRAAWISAFVSCWALAACLEIAETSPDDGSGGSGGTSVGGGGAAGAAGGSGMGGGNAGAGAGGTDAGWPPAPFGSSDLSSEHSGDSAPNASSMTFTAHVPPTTRFLLACAHFRDNDTSVTLNGTMLVAGQPMTPVDPPAVGTDPNHQAGVQCFSMDDPPTGTNAVQFQLQSGTYDYVRISTFYFARPATISARTPATHPAANIHDVLMSTGEPSLVLAVYTKYYTQLPSTVGFIELFNEAGFGGEAVQYAAVLVQAVAGEARWTVTWSGYASWGGAELLAIVPK